jgi:hypothetical protein
MMMMMIRVSVRISIRVRVSIRVSDQVSRPGLDLETSFEGLGLGRSRDQF